MKSYQVKNFPGTTIAFFPVLALIFSACSGGSGIHDRKAPPPSHVLPDAPIEEILQQPEVQEALENPSSIDPRLQGALTAGERLLKWVSLANSVRDGNSKISLSSAATQRGIPVEAPNKYSVELIAAKELELRATLPQVFLDVLWGETAPTIELPMSDEEFVQWGLEVNRLYQSATRWIMLSPYLDYYKERQHSDVRGYYFLKQISDLEARLKTFDTLDVSTREQYTKWLSGLCLNSALSSGLCQQELDAQILQNAADVSPYYLKYVGQSKKTYDKFFEIPAKRGDIVWSSQHPDVAYIPFRDPVDSTVWELLSKNIENEWKFGGWNLTLLKVGPNTAQVPFIEFIAGATPHVDRLAGNQIVMDSNEPLTEYNVQWTMRHEFGHVLGLPDCYVEFYDDSEAAMVNYQLDIGDLMCSRKGKINQRIYDEMKESYYLGD